MKPNDNLKSQLYPYFLCYPICFFSYIKISQKFLHATCSSSCRTDDKISILNKKETRKQLWRQKERHYEKFESCLIRREK